MTKIEKLTQAQIDSMPSFRDKWIGIGRDTGKLDLDVAIAATRLAYESADVTPPRFFMFPKGPTEAMKFLSIASKIKLTEADFVRLANESVTALTDTIRAALVAEEQTGSVKFEKKWPGFYGQHEAGWLSFYDFFAEHFDISEGSNGLRELAKNSGWVWMFGDLAIICEKPFRVTVNASGDAHNEKMAAIEYNDGTKVYSFNGVSLPEKWVLERDTMDPSEILAETDVDKRAAGIALYGYSRLKHSLSYNIIQGDPETDIGALIEISIPGLTKKGRFLEAMCPRNGPVFLGVPATNPWDDNKPITNAVAAQAFLARLPESAYQHPPIRT